METFVCGNPRVLSGGALPVPTNYENAPRTVGDAAPLDTRRARTLPGTLDAVAKAGVYGQKVYEGKTSYHNTPYYNVFLREGEWPSAGVELETHLKRMDPSFAERAMADLRSNWFHFERDGSLDRAHGGNYGYELITVPLPPRAYRNPELWEGLQNLVSPWLESFNCEETGLHVHVGLNQFEGFDSIPVKASADRRAVGKLLSAVVYYCVVDASFLDRVVLRRMTGYCNMQAVPEFTDAGALVATGRATGGDLVDYCVSRLARRNSSTWLRTVSACGFASPGHQWFPDLVLASGHGTEINQEHSRTIEFRRAKGTVHALSVHRIVELMTSIVRFAGKLCREPDFVVTRDSFLEWLERTTTSEALRSLAKQAKGQ